MICSKCQHTNSDTANFCVECGQQMASAQIPPAAPNTGVSHPVGAVPPIPPPRPPAVPHPVYQQVPPSGDASPVYPSAQHVPIQPIPQPTSNMPPVYQPVPQSVATSVIDATNVTAKPKKSGFVILGVTALAVVVMLCINLLDGSAYQKIENGWVFASNDMDEIILFDHYGSTLKFDAERFSVYRSLQASINGNVLAFFSEENGSYLLPENTLVVINDGTPTTLSDEVGAFIMSPDGSTLVYTIPDFDSNYGLSTLYYYDIAGKKTTKISDMVMSDSLAISPNGKTVAYATGEDEEAMLRDNEFTAMLYNGGKSSKIDDKIKVFAVSDNGKNMIWSKTDKSGNEITYITFGKNEHRLSNFMSIYVNADFSQIIYTTNNRTYLLEAGKERIQVASAFLYPTLRPNEGSFISQGGITYLSAKDLKDYLYSSWYSGSGIYSLDKNGEGSRIISSPDNFALLEDGSLYYVKNDRLFLYNAEGKENEAIVRNVGNNFAVLGKFVYYISSDDTLYVKNGKKDATRVSYDVYSLETNLANDTVYFMTKDSPRDNYGDLYYMSGGKEKVKIASDVTQWIVAGNRVYYLLDDVLYVVVNNKKPEKLVDGIEDLSTSIYLY